jgi:hypothetical protein
MFQQTWIKVRQNTCHKHPQKTQLKNQTISSSSRQKTKKKKKFHQLRGKTKYENAAKNYYLDHANFRLLRYYLRNATGFELQPSQQRQPF